MAQHLTDEEQLQVLKNWWKDNGTLLVLVVAVAVSAYVGWGWWKNHQQNYAESASLLFKELAEVIVAPEGEALNEEQRNTAQYLIKQLQDDYGSTLYAVNASLVAAKLAVDSGDLDTAEQQLKLALSLGDDDANTISSLRLGRVYLAQEKYDDALSFAKYDKDDEFTGLYAVLRGDIYVGKGDVTQAEAAYQQALDKMGDSNSPQRRIVEAKLSNLGPQDKS